MALTKKFGKHFYHFDSFYHSEGRARSQAERLRKQGFRARVVKIDWLTWEVWRR